MKFLQKKVVVLALLVTVFLAPGFVALCVYQHPDWLSKTTINKGRLLPQPSVHFKQLTGSWSLVLWQPEACGSACYKTLNKLHHIRLALGRRYYETNLWLINKTSTTPDHPLGQALEIPFHIMNTHTKTLFNHFGTQPLIFISNPQGYFILAYEPNRVSQDVYQDLQHLLKLNEKSVSSSSRIKSL